MKNRIEQLEKKLESPCNQSADDQSSSNDTVLHSKGKSEEGKEKSFLSRLGDAIIKAIPEVLKTAVTVALGYIFKGSINLRFGKSKKGVIV